MISKERLQDLIRNEKIIYLKTKKQVIELNLNNKWYIDGCYLCKEVEWLKGAFAKHNLLDLYETEQAIEEEKFETISTLKQEIQILKIKWQMLKDFVVSEKLHNEEIDAIEYLQEDITILEKMQELEKE